MDATARSCLSSHWELQGARLAMRCHLPDCDHSGALESRPSRAGRGKGEAGQTKARLSGFRSCAPWKCQGVWCSRGSLGCRHIQTFKSGGASLLTYVTVNVVGHSFGDSGFLRTGMPCPNCGLQVFQGRGESREGNFDEPAGDVVK